MTENKKDEYEVHEELSFKCECGAKVTGERLAKSRKKLEETGWFDAVEDVLLWGLCRDCMKKREGITK